MDVVEFGEQLILTNDLDPIYVALYESKLESKQLQRWLLSYWLFYHPGVASKASELEGREFYRFLASDPRHPRGRERRHFRGHTSEFCLSYLANTFPEPEEVVERFVGVDLKFDSFSRSIQKLPAFGPWIAFKSADMLERLGLSSIKFDNIDFAIYSEPKEGAAMAIDDLLRRGQVGMNDVKGVCRVLEGQLGHLQAPPRYERKVGFQEIETVLCKYKAMRNGHYYVGADIDSIQKIGGEWGVTYETFRSNMPVVVGKG